MVIAKAPPIREAPPDSRGPDLREMDVETLVKLYPPKLEPMPEGARQFRPILMIGDVLIRFFERTKREATIFSDVFIYYPDECGEVSNVAPDLCVAFDVNMDDLDDDRSYFVERIGKPPEWVMEIGSPATARRDVEEKPAIYAQVGAGEYWLFDAEDGDVYGFPLMGLRLVDGEYQEIELTRLPNGAVRGYSEALGLILQVLNGVLRFIDPATDRILRTSSELEADERAARREAAEERRKREAVEAELRRLLDER